MKLENDICVSEVEWMDLIVETVASVTSDTSQIHLRCFLISDTVEETLRFAHHVQTDELFPAIGCWLVLQLVVFGLMLKASHIKEVA